MSQNYEIKDLDPTEEKEPSCFKCNRCDIELNGISTSDNCLGQDPFMCKHWCDICFEEIKRWIRSQKEQVEKKIQTTLNFNEKQNEK